MPAAAERSRQRHRRLGGAFAALLVLELRAGYCAVASRGPLAARAAWPPASDLVEHTAVMHVHSSHFHDGQGSDHLIDLFPIGGAGYRPWIFSNPVHVRA